MNYYWGLDATAWTAIIVTIAVWGPLFALRWWANRREAKKADAAGDTAAAT